MFILYTALFFWGPQRKKKKKDDLFRYKYDLVTLSHIYVKLLYIFCDIVPSDLKYIGQKSDS